MLGMEAVAARMADHLVFHSHDDARLKKNGVSKTVMEPALAPHLNHTLSAHTTQPILRWRKPRASLCSPPI